MSTGIERTDETWRYNAACLGADPDMFEAQGRGSPPVAGLRLCGRCPVRTACLADALRNDTEGDHGIWGGTTVRHRAHIRVGRWTLERAMAEGDRIAQRTRQNAAA